MFYIYKLTSPDNKIYIGQTKQKKIYKRWQYGCGYKANKRLYEDILAYGWDNFKHEIIDTAETKEEALQKEREYILQFKSNVYDKGYNKNVKISKTYTYIRCVDTGEMFESMTAAGAACGRSKQAISYAIVNKTKCARKYWEKVELDSKLP